MGKGNVGVDRYLGHSINLDAHLAESLPVFIKKANILYISTNAGWVATATGSGITEQGILFLVVRTGATANSSARLTIELAGFSQEVGLSWLRITWDKKLYLILNVGRQNADAEAVARVQIKETDVEGALGAKGIGLRIDNLALVGESYGTELGTVDLATSLTEVKEKQVVIIHSPAIPAIYWYVNGVLKGTQSTAANIPSGSAGATTFMVYSIKNGADGGSDARLFIFQPKIWQER